MQLRNTKDIAVVLSEIGLTKNESDVYVYLLQAGQTKASELPRILEMDKSSLYRALKNLVDENLIYKIGEERNVEYAPNDTSIIQSKLKDKIAYIKDVKHNFEHFLSDIESYAQRKYKKNNVIIFQGTDGFSSWNDYRLLKSDVVIRELSQRIGLRPFFTTDEDYDSYMMQYIKKRVSKKIPIRVLIGKQNADDTIDITSSADLKESRILPMDFNVEAGLSTWGNNTGFVSFNKGNILAIILKDPFITQAINVMYDVLWNISTPKPEDVTNSIHKNET